jgi:tetratricopeptide (TPR) repeat protein
MRASLLLSIFVALTAMLTACGPTASDYTGPCHDQTMAHKTHDAIATCTQALSLEPDNVGALKDRCLAYTDARMFDLALPDCAEAVKVGPDVTTYSVNCFALGQAKKLQAALQQCNAAIQADGSNGYAYSKRCGVRSDLGDLDGALDDCNKAIASNADLGDAYNSRCLVHEERGDYHDALADCNKSIGEDNQDAVTYNNRCLVYHDLKEYHLALDDCTKAIHLAPEIEDPYNNRCLVYNDLDNYAAAARDCHSALTIDPRDMYALTNMCQTQDNLKNYSTALDYCKRALKIAPNEGDVWASTANVYADLDDPQNAVRALAMSEKTYRAAGKNKDADDAHALMLKIAEAAGLNN